MTQKSSETAIATISHDTVEAVAESLGMLTEMVGRVLIEGTDYGKIPGVSKNSLFKPGAATVLATFNCRPQPSLTYHEVNEQTGFVSIVMTVEAVHITTGNVMCAGVGSCTSYETKYRYRWEGRGESRHRIENPDLLEQYNTYLKMAEKRALVDCAMHLPGVARFFTQDVEDYAPGTVATVATTNTAVAPVGDAEMGYCPLHKVAFEHRTGTAKASGNPYDFWSCPEKVGDKYCQQKPDDYIIAEFKAMGLDTSGAVDALLSTHETTLDAVQVGRSYPEVITFVHGLMQPAHGLMQPAEEEAAHDYEPEPAPPGD